MLFGIDADTVEKKCIKADAADHSAVRDSGNVRAEHLRDDRQFFEAILAAVEGDLDEKGHWLIVGAGNPVKEFGKYVQDHARTLEAKLVGVELMDQATEEKVLEVARRHLKATKRTAPTASNAGQNKARRRLA